MSNLRVAATRSSGIIEPGAHLNFRLEDLNGNPDNVPDTGFQWYIYHNGRRLNHLELQRITHDGHGNPVTVLHTFNRRAIGFILRPEVSGQFTVTGQGHGLSPSYNYTISSTVSAEEPTLSDLQSQLDRIEQQLSGLVK